MFSEVAHAQSGLPQGEAPPALQQMFMPIVIIAVLGYFLLYRPQRDQERKQTQMLKDLKRNDEVITAGGLYGKVRELSDTVLTLEVANNVRVRVVRAQIKDVVKKPSAEEKDRRREKEKASG